MLSKKGIVILASELLFEFQMSEQSEAIEPSWCVCLEGVHPECGKCIIDTFPHSWSRHIRKIILWFAFLTMQECGNTH